MWAAGLGTLPWKPGETPEWPCLPRGEHCVPRQAGQDRTDRTGRTELPGQHSHRGIPGSQVMWQCKQQAEFTKRQNRGTAPQPGLMSCSRVRVWDWDSWFLLATRQGPGNHLTLLCIPMVCLPWSLAKSCTSWSRCLIDSYRPEMTPAQHLAGGLYAVARVL